MSIANTILQPPAGYLLIDMARFSEDGTVWWIGPKVAAIQDRRMAMGCVGGGGSMLRCISVEIARFRRDSARSTADIVAAFPELFAAAYAREKSRYFGHVQSVEMQVLYYSETMRRTLACLIASSDEMIGGAEPYVMHPVMTALTNAFSPDEPFGEPCDVTDPRQFDIERDGLALMEAQRRKPWKPYRGMPAGHYAGGGAMLTTVDVSGVRTKQLADWPHRVGQLVCPTI